MASAHSSTPLRGSKRPTWQIAPVAQVSGRRAASGRIPPRIGHDGHARRVDGVARQHFLGDEPARTEHRVGVFNRILLQRRCRSVVGHARIPAVGREDALGRRVDVHHAGRTSLGADAERPAQLQVVEGRLPFLRLDDIHALAVDQGLGHEGGLPGERLRWKPRGQQPRGYARAGSRRRDGTRIRSRVVERHPMQHEAPVQEFLTTTRARLPTDGRSRARFRRRGPAGW